MNMKQSCKALICAIEGELDGRHCTEEQAAAILDHALPSLTEALARAEAERDTAIAQMQNIRRGRDAINKELGDTGFNLCIAQQQLTEAEGLLKKARRYVEQEYPDGIHSYRPNSISGYLLGDVDAFLARLAQVEQQEAKPATFYDAIKNPPRIAPTLQQEARAALATQPAVRECSCPKIGERFSAEKHASPCPVHDAARGAEHE